MKIKRGIIVKSSHSMGQRNLNGVEGRMKAAVSFKGSINFLLIKELLREKQWPNNANWSQTLTVPLRQQILCTVHCIPHGVWSIKNIWKSERDSWWRKIGLAHSWNSVLNFRICQVTLNPPQTLSPTETGTSIYCYRHGFSGQLRSWQQ